MQPSFELAYQPAVEEDEESAKPHIVGFRGSVFPIIGSLVATFAIGLSYHIALKQHDVKPFPWTDITHTGIKYPEYIPLRIGLMVAAPVFVITFQLLKNYLQITSFEIMGVPEPRVNCFGYLSILSCIALSISTATMSDGGDMNWTAHVAGATSFFLISLFIIIRASYVYRKLWVVKQFCPKWSYQIKKYANFVVIGFILLTVADSMKWIDIGSFVEWAATFYLVLFFFSLFWDFKGMQIWFMRK